jgi:hypothetical protein
MVPGGTAVVQRYFSEPYRFVPPYRSTLWCRLLGGLVPGHLRRRLGVQRWQFEGLDHLRRSLAAGCGVLLAVNHSRWVDPPVVGVLGLEIGRYFYYLVSYHLFRQGRFTRWYLNRLGGYSVNREGTDRESLRVSVRIVAHAERPLVIFPEGTYYRQNDRLGPLQEGFSLIARQAVRRGERPVVVHPVALKYWCLQDPRPAIAGLLQRRERGLGWPTQRDLDLLPRLEKLGEALVAVQEIGHFGQAHSGPLDDRLLALAAAMVAKLEGEYAGRTFDGRLMERVRRLRQVVMPHMAEADAEVAERAGEALRTLLLCENLNCQSLAYLRQRPSFERLAETMLRLEEAVTDVPEPFLVPLGVVGAVGPALDMRDYEGGPRKGRRGRDPLIEDTAAGMQALLDRLLNQGPPADWGCPAPLGPAPLPAAAPTAPPQPEPVGKG